MDHRLLDHFKSHFAALQNVKLKQNLNALGVEILESAFSECGQLRRIQDFYEHYVFPHKQQVALCGINPGRFGAGKSGIPFVDVDSLTRLLGLKVEVGTERSAQFIRRVVDHFGASRFYAHVYVTNLSTFGFRNKNRNVNYYELPQALQSEIFRWFAAEMSIGGINVIIPCSQKVYQTLRNLQRNGTLTATIHEPLPHPNWCAFPKNYASALEKYVQVLTPFLS
jgi:hypothetical protein